MKKIRIEIIYFFIISILIFLPLSVYAKGGQSGYEGGISSGKALEETSFEYQEMCFITGEPLLFKGTLKIKKTLKGDDISSTYTYNLTNDDKAATLTRVISYNTKLINKEGGQVIEETQITKQPTEVIRFGSTLYILRSYDFTSSSIIDKKPAVDYYAGDLWSKKIYQTGLTGNGGTVTIESTGNFYGYDQYWGTAETVVYNYNIESKQNKDGKIDKWGGVAKVSISATTTKQIKYVENIPDQISFNGSYKQEQYNNSILKYSSEMPEFDSKGVSTDNIKNSSGSLKLETFPDSKRLPVFDLRHLRGHWAEEEIEKLFSLEIFKGRSDLFKPEQYITKAEFISAVVEAAKEVPEDLSVVKKKTRTAVKKSKLKEEKVAIFKDIPNGSIYFDPIENAYKRGIITGAGNKFFPENKISVADAVTILIRTLGLEKMSPSPNPVTIFRDNDQIPAYAREAIYVAERIGIIKGDERGYIKPGENLTKASAASLLNEFIGYMRDGIKKDYRERIVNY